MLKTKKATREVEEVCSIVCNKCGNEDFVNQDSMSDFEGLGEVNIAFGYFSKHFGDGARISFALCEKCLYDIVETFEIDPSQEGPWWENV